MQISLRRGTYADARAAADLWLRARKAAADAIPYPVHGDDDVRRWFASHVVPDTELWVAEDAASRLVGILVLDGPWVDQLYVEPTLTGRGIGARLLALAKHQRPEGLRLWTFASNTAAQRFYERHGFVVSQRTEGEDNEEGAPDILYLWPAAAVDERGQSARMLARGVKHNRSIPPATVIPVLIYPDVRAAVDWLGAAFGFVERVWIGENHRAQLTFGEGGLIVGDVRGERRPPRPNEVTHSVMVRVQDARAHCERARQHGAQILMEPTDFEYGERQYTAQDPAGHQWTFSETLADVAPEDWGGQAVTPY